MYTNERQSAVEKPLPSSSGSAFFRRHLSGEPQLNSGPLSFCGPVFVLKPPKTFGHSNIFTLHTSKTLRHSNKFNLIPQKPTPFK